MKCTNSIGCGCDSDAREGCPFATPETCPYCEKADDAWLGDDLSRGTRPALGGGVGYHCYAGYCLD